MNTFWTYSIFIKYQKKIKQFKVFDFFTDTCRTLFFSTHSQIFTVLYGFNFRIQPKFHKQLDHLDRPLVYQKWNIVFFSKFIFTKWQFTIIIKIHKLFHIYSFYFLFITHQVAQRQSAELVSQGSQVLISLLTKTFFSKIILKIHSEDFKNVKQFFLKKIIK